MDILSIGEALIDFTPGEAENTYIQNFGGAPANLAVVASRLGAKAGFVGKVGADVFGRCISDFLKGEGVDISGLAFTHKASTTLAFVHLDGSGERSFQFVRNPGADMLLSPEDICDAQIASARIIHLGSAQLMVPSARDACDKAVRLAHACGRAVSFDPNYREAQWEAPSAAAEQMLPYLREADLIKLSLEELEMLTGETDIGRGAASLGCRPEALLVVSEGGRGAGFHYRGRTEFVPGYRQRAVDTTGAGDAFWGAFLSRLCQEAQRLAGNALDPDTIRRAISWGNAAGALCVTCKGAVPRTICPQNIRQLMQDGAAADRDIF